MKNNNVKSAIWIGSTTFLAYAACYSAKNILSAVMPQMVNEKVFSNEAFGSMGSSFFLTYGIGQLINGLIGNKISAKYMVAIGLFLSGILVAAFPFCGSVQISLLLWGVCGFLCSMLWGPISKLVGENTNPDTGKIILTVLTIASIIGTAATYGFAVISSLNNNWKIGFYITGALLVVISILWYICNIWMEKAKIIKQCDNVRIIESNETENKIEGLLAWGFISMTIVTMLNGVVRNAVAFWIPTFISDKLGMKIELVAVISSILPVFNILGTFVSLYALKFVDNNEKKMSLLLFVITTIAFAVLYILNGRLVLLSIFALFIASAAMMGVCNLIFSVYVLRFVDTGKLSGIAGFLDFSSYMSAAGASIVFAKISTVNWNTVIFIWIVTAFIGMIFTYASYKNDKTIISERKDYIESKTVS